MFSLSLEAVRRTGCLPEIRWSGGVRCPRTYPYTGRDLERDRLPAAPGLALLRLLGLLQREELDDVDQVRGRHVPGQALGHERDIARRAVRHVLLLEGEELAVRVLEG